MLLIHIGYHKTGTTWLRHRLFSRADLGFHLCSRYSREMASLLHPHALDFDADTCRRAYAATIEQCEAEGRVAVIMHERLSGDPHSGGYDSKELADRLCRTFPNARILIGIREQRSAILSCYKQYLKYGGACRLRDYLRPKSDHRLPQFSMAHFRYHRLIAYYRSLFGCTNVLVQPYERFRAEPDAYVRTITAFCDVDEPGALAYDEFVNVPMKPVALGVKRVLNPFIRRDSVNGNSPFALAWLGAPSQRLLQFLNRSVGDGLNARLDRQWKTEIDEATRGCFEESNRRTSALLNVDLSAYGYRT